MFGCSMLAQKTENIVGLYRTDIGSGSSGSTNYFILEDHSFYLTGFGTFIKGNWTIDDKNIVKLFPKNPEQSFVLFGRNNPKIKGSMKIRFDGDDFGRNKTYISIDNDNSLKKVFSRINANSANSFTKYDNFKGLISFSDDKNQVYNFKIDNNFNDFVVYYYNESSFYKPFEFEFTQKEEIQKKDLEELNFIHSEIYNDDEKVIYKNSSYSQFTSKSLNIKKYKYNKSKNAYLNSSYNEAFSDLNQETDYNDTSLIYKYELIKLNQKIKVQLISNYIFEP